MSDNFYCDVDVLIASVKKRECLWNYKIKEYCNKTIKNRAWMEVVAETTPDFENKSMEEKNIIGIHLQTKWKNLKDAFIRNCRNMKKKSGSAASTPRLYPFYEQMLFLKNIAEERGFTTSSISAPLPSDSEASELIETPKPTTASTAQGKRKFNKEEEDKLIQKLSKRLEDKINKEQELEKHLDEDKLFLLSLLSDFKKISNEFKLDVKSEIIQVIKKYRDTSVNSAYSYTRYSTGPTPSSHPNSYFNSYSTLSPLSPVLPQTTTRLESQSSSHSYEGASISTGVSSQTARRLSSQSCESVLSPESIINDLFS